MLEGRVDSRSRSWRVAELEAGKAVVATTNCAWNTIPLGLRPIVTFQEFSRQLDLKSIAQQWVSGKQQRVSYREAIRLREGKLIVLPEPVKMSSTFGGWGCFLTAVGRRLRKIFNPMHIS